MTRISKVPLDNHVYKDVTNSFIRLVSGLKENSEIEEFLGDFLTKEEKLMLSKRLVLALMLSQRYSVGEIQDALKVSRTTINLMKHWLAYKKGISKGIRKLIDKDKARYSAKKSESILKHIPPLTRSKKDMANWLSR